MSELTNLKLRIPKERYIALIHFSNVKDRSLNAQINHLIEKALNEFIDEIKSVTRGHDGGNDE